MPKITIREKDLTGNETYQFLDDTALVPGREILVAGQLAFGGLFTSLAQFDAAAIVAGITNPETEPDAGFKIARLLLKQGMSIHYAPSYTEVAESGEVAAYQKLSTTVAELFADFQDRGKYDLKFITTGGIKPTFKQPGTGETLDDKTIADAIKEAIRCAGNRGDAVAVVSAPEDKLTVEAIDAYVSAESGESGATGIAELCNTAIIRNGVTFKNSATETYGQYGATFSPWFTSGSETLPGWVDYLACFAKHTDNYPSWFAMAGSIRGVSPLSGVTPEIALGDADIEILQRREKAAGESGTIGHISTNAICEIRPYGNVIWGNRTMHPLSKPASDASAPEQLLASDFLNIRMLCCAIKKQLYRSARRFTYEPNSDVMWFNFKATITPLLEQMKSNQGIRGYQIIKLATKKKAVLAAKIKITPIEAVEDFDFDIELSDSITVSE